MYKLHETKCVKPDMQEIVSTASEADEGSTYDSRVAALEVLYKDVERATSCD